MAINNVSTQGVNQTYTPTSGNNNVNTSSQVSSNGLTGYEYGEDVFVGDYAPHKEVFMNFNQSISQYSPFSGRMGGQTTENVPTTNTGNPPANTGNVPTTIPTNNNTQPVNVKPKFDIQSGPVDSNTQQLLQQEMQNIAGMVQSNGGTPQDHATLIIRNVSEHLKIAYTSTVKTRHLIDGVGALFKAKKALSMAGDPSKKNEVIKLESATVSDLNHAKKESITTYNELLKATLVYNEFFTGEGQYANILNDSDRQFLEGELNKAWKLWSGGAEIQIGNVSISNLPASHSMVDMASQQIMPAFQQINQQLGI